MKFKVKRKKNTQEYKDAWNKVINELDSKKFDDDTLRIVKQYVDGTKELEDVQKEILERFKESD